MLLLTDGTVIAHEENDVVGNYATRNWYKLTPDINGSYINGTWSEIAPLPVGYGPLAFGSAVLPDGRVVVEGGEFNQYGNDYTNLGAIYDPVANTWTKVKPPSGWSHIGDASTVVLNNGALMLANAETRQAAILNPLTLTWTATGSGKFDVNLEEGWTLLPNGKVLTVDKEAPELNPDLVVRDKKGEIYTVRYDAVNAMLLNEFLKEHKAFVEEQRKVQEQDCKLQERGAMIARQQKQIDALTAGLQKVSAQLELTKSAPRTVQNNHESGLTLTTFEIANVLVRFNHVASRIVVNANPQRLCRRIQNADMTRTIWQDY
jgi:hypothetical protein